MPKEASLKDFLRRYSKSTFRFTLIPTPLYKEKTHHFNIEKTELLIHNFIFFSLRQIIETIVILVQ